MDLKSALTNARISPWAIIDRIAKELKESTEESSSGWQKASWTSAWNSSEGHGQGTKWQGYAQGHDRGTEWQGDAQWKAAESDVVWQGGDKHTGEAKWKGSDGWQTAERDSWTGSRE